MKIFKDRQSAGKLLAERLKGDWGNLGDKGIVLGIPRGGVLVAAEVSRVLHLPLDIIITRKIGAPFQPELALGAVDTDGEIVGEIGEIGEMKEIIKREIGEIKRREELYNAARYKKRSDVIASDYRGGRKPLEVSGKTVILVDDGIATGATTLAAINYLKRHHVKKIILAVPVASKESIAKVREVGDVGEVVVLETPQYFQAVGQFYQDFQEVSDEEVIYLLNHGS